MRDIATSFAEAFAAPRVQPALMGEFFFDEQTIGVWTGLGDLEYNGLIYTGLGNLIGISPIEENQGTEAKGIVVSLNGISPTLISLALAERCRGRRMHIYLASVESKSKILLEDESGGIKLEDGSGYILLQNQLTNQAERVFAGLMDVMEISDNGETADIRLSVENILIVGQRAKLRRYTSEDQKRIYPDDEGLDFINRLQDKEIVW